MRSPKITRLYLQCRPDEDLGEWPDARLWDELSLRLGGADGFAPVRGAILQKSVTPMRAFVAAPMQHGRLFLAGDAAHIVPPTGAKGMNLAIADVIRLARALEAHYRGGGDGALHDYSAPACAACGRAVRFSNQMTMMLHRHDGQSPLQAGLQMAELAYAVSPDGGAAALARCYVGDFPS